MKRLLLSAILLGASVVYTHAQAPAEKPADLTTLSGKTYKQARAFRVEPDGITYMYAGGMSKIPFTDLPEEARKKYNYDPKQAAAFAQADADEQAQAQAGAAQQRVIAAQRQHELDMATAGHLEAVRTTAAAAPQYSSSLDAPAVRRDPVNGKVLQIVDDGMLVVKDKRVVMVSGYPKQDTVVEDADCVMICQLSGSYEYKAADGTSKRVAEYKYSSGTVTNPR